ncbi:transcriptional regulator domain-containing protein [Komagataeibacter diospyri]
MPISDWQSPAAYEHAKDIAAAGMAWEYLRRDDEYRRAF